MGENICDHGLRKDFLDRKHTKKEPKTKPKIDKLNFIKIKNFILEASITLYVMLEMYFKRHC